MADEHLDGDGDDAGDIGPPPGSARRAADDSLVGDPSGHPSGAEEIDASARTASEVQEDSDRDEFKDIGDGHRWYDPAYHLSGGYSIRGWADAFHAAGEGASTMPATTYFSITRYDAIGL